MLAQLWPPELQRRHWYANEVGFADHAPGVPVSTWPGFVVPETTGSAVTAGVGPPVAGTAVFSHQLTAPLRTGARKSVFSA